MQQIKDAPTGSAISYSKRMAFGPNSSKGSSSMRSISKTEFVGNVAGSVNFFTASYHINPGLPATFPWLSTLAKDWQQYRFKRLRARYITRSATTSPGSVILSPEYNILEGPPLSEQEAANTQDAVEDVTWRELVCEMDISAMFAFGPRKQVRTQAIGADLTTYDAAILTVATVGQAAGGTIGKLYLDYEIDFFVPQSTGPSRTVSQRITEIGNFSNVALNNGVTSEVFINASFISNALGVNLLAPGHFGLPSGTYRIDISVNTFGNAGFDLVSSAHSTVNGGHIGPNVIVSTASSGGFGSQNQNYLTFILSTNGNDDFSPIITCTDSAVVPVLGVLAVGSRMLVTLI